MNTKFQKQLDRLESLAETKFKDIEKENYEKYFYIYKIAIDFLKGRSDVLLYGGTAINEILPKKFKIYDEYELPDVDIFTSNSKKLINAILSHYKKNFKDVKLVYYNVALHENTYKLYAEGLQVLDITEIPKKDFKFLKKSAINTEIGIPSVGTRFIKFTLHLLSAQSYDSRRWSKVYDRLIKIYKQYPVDNNNIKWEEFYNTELPSDIYTKLTDWVESSQLISFGMDKIEKFIKKPQNVTGFPVLYLLSDKDTISILKSLDKDIKISKRYKISSMIEPYYVLSYKKDKIGYIFDTESCYSIIYKNNKKELTLHSIICLLYKLYLSSRDEESIFIPIIDKLTKIVISYSNDTTKLKELYSIECYGNQAGLTTLRRNKAMRLKNNKDIFANALVFYRIFML